MRLVILERDGVINHPPEGYLRAVDQWQPIAGSLEAIARLNRAGCRVVVVTRDAGLDARSFDIEALNRVHHHMYHQLAEVGGSIDAVLFCTCPPARQCGCFGPDSGVLRTSAERLRTSLDQAPVVAAGTHHLEATRAAGAVPVMLLSRGDPDPAPATGEVAIHEDLSAFADAYA